MKKAVVLFGSPKKNGYTAKLLNNFLSKLSNYEVVIIYSYDENIYPCVDCGHCKKNEKCIFNDFDKIDMLLNNSDLLIIATPIYNLSFPSPMKAIIDRTQIYYNARFYRNIVVSKKKAKKAILITTCGSDNKRGIDIIVKQLQQTFTIINARIVKIISQTNTDI